MGMFVLYLVVVLGPPVAGASFAFFGVSPVLPVSIFTAGAILAFIGRQVVRRMVPGKATELLQELLWRILIGCLLAIPMCLSGFVMHIDPERW